jgi:hypothetical protein
MRAVKNEPVGLRHAIKRLAIWRYNIDKESFESALYTLINKADWDNKRKLGRAYQSYVDALDMLSKATDETTFFKEWGFRYSSKSKRIIDTFDPVK